MNRLERLSAILFHLQSKRTAAAKELAERFGICLRTVYRDIRSLENAGIPIGSEPGKGYFLAEGYHLPPVTLTPEEAGALLLAGKLARAYADVQTGRSFESALDKIKAALTGEGRGFVSEMENKMAVYEAENSANFAENYIKDIQKAVFSKKVLEIDYLSASGMQTWCRRIEPVSLGFDGGAWHIVAYCHKRNAYRDFRVDNIMHMSVTCQCFHKEHPPIEEVLRIMHESKNLSPAAVRLKKDRGYEIIKKKCGLGILEEKDADGCAEITFLVDSLPVLGNWLFRYCKATEVLYPKELEDAIKDCARETAGKYLSEQ